MRRIRVEQSSEHVVVPVAVLMDVALSMKAKGLLCLLLAAPQDEPLMRYLSAACPDGKGAIETGLDELVAAGYVNEVAGVLVVSTHRNDQKLGKVPSGKSEKLDKVKPAAKNENPPKLPGNDPKIGQSAQGGERGGDIRGASTEVSLEGEVIPSGRATKTNEPMANELFPELEDTPKLLRNSLVGTFGAMVVHFQDEEAAGIDLRHYFDSIQDWSETGGSKNKPVKRTSRGWIATMRTWMRNDQEKGKLRMLKGATTTDLSRYFNH
jgi:hypothetical protein